MTSMAAHARELFVKPLEAQADQIRMRILNGGVKDFADYRYEVGRYAATVTAIKSAEEGVKAFGEDDFDDDSLPTMPDNVVGLPKGGA